MKRLFGLLVVIGISTPLAAQDGALHLLVVSGLSGERSFAASFATAAGAIRDVARTSWGVPDSSNIWLAEDPAVDPTRIKARSTRDEIGVAIAQLARRSAAGDVIAIILIGHGSGEGATSRVGLPGPDPTVLDYARWLDPIRNRTILFVVAASGSGDFLPTLSGPGRIVVTATKNAIERNESLFGSRFAHGLSSAEADADKDGRTTVLEAFQYAKREVAAAYAVDNRLMTEHAVFDDNGDRVASAEPATGSDGVLARRVSFGRASGPVDSATAALLAERRQLETEVEQLRRRKDSMSESAYLTELERLLVAIAERTRAIRAVGERRP